MKQFFLCLLFLSQIRFVMGQNKTERSLSQMTETWDTEVPVTTPAKLFSDAPSDAIILFSGKNLSNEWTDKDGGAPKWAVADNYFTVVSGAGHIQTKRLFNDFQLHLEWKSPTPAVGESQSRGNSGIFLQGLYEVQILDDFNNRTYSNGRAGSIYKQFAPLVNAGRSPGEWQVYDIIYTAPRFNNGKYFTQPYVTILYNGILVQNHVALRGPTIYELPEFNIKPHTAGPIILQDHQCAVSFRNIWIREL